jgi:hypothetical protein
MAGMQEPMTGRGLELTTKLQHRCRRRCLRRIRKTAAPFPMELSHPQEAIWREILMTENTSWRPLDLDELACHPAPVQCRLRRTVALFLPVPT